MSLTAPANDDLREATARLSERVERLLLEQAESHPARRILIALAGVPGSGKSTISAAVIQELRNRGVKDIAVLPMDGFHFSRAVLASFSDPDMAFRRRGAPFTFDADGFVALVRQLRETPVTGPDEPQNLVTAPSFDHAAKDPVPDAISVSSQTRLVILEGNYTLLNESPWNKIAEMVDDRWFVDVSADIARERLAARHLAAGIETTRESALARADENDVPNGDHVRRNLIEPSIRIIN